MENPLTVYVIGPKDRGRTTPNRVRIDATSRSAEAWSRGLSPFHLGPVPLYGGRVAVTMENAWQYAKLYAGHADGDGAPLPAYWAWAGAGWADARARRHPQGRGARPLHCLWDGRRLGYAEARRQVYWPLYRDAVAATPAWRTLRAAAAAGDVEVFDFDGYAGASVAAALADMTRPMGHAFVLAAMLEHGEGVAPEDAERPR